MEEKKHKNRVSTLKSFIIKGTAAFLSLMLVIGIFYLTNTSYIPDAVTAFAFSSTTEKNVNKNAIFVNNDNNENSDSSKNTGFAGKKLIVGGMPFGIKLYTDGILISGTGEVDTSKGNENPGKSAGLSAGDIIKKINGKEVSGVRDILDAAFNSDGNPLKLHIQRGNKHFETEITPLLSESENAYKLGLWVRDGTAGIGTVTYIDPETNYFGGLGHGVCDSDTGIILPMSRGKLNEVTINAVDKGVKGDPGELRGFFSSDEIGVLISNTDYGVFGVYNNIDLSNTREIECGCYTEVKEGAASILCTLSSNNICEYDIEIEEICKNSGGTKNFIVKVTDEELIKETGGIVQGMSGSPIIQNGKLIGAVTHVLVEDPTRGYGIFIENMLIQQK